MAVQVMNYYGSNVYDYPAIVDGQHEYFLVDESGSSTVAIDNKIEQAMDLVKSHLMFAVREEVEVLREQIKELLEQKAQLEYENTVLKSAALPETLQKLSNGPPPQPPTTSAS